MAIDQLLNDKAELLCAKHTQKKKTLCEREYNGIVEKLTLIELEELVQCVDIGQLTPSPICIVQWLKWSEKKARAKLNRDRKGTTHR